MVLKDWPRRERGWLQVPLPSDYDEWGRWPIGKGGSSARPELIKACRCPIYEQRRAEKHLLFFFLFFLREREKESFCFPILYDFFLSSTDAIAETAIALDDGILDMLWKQTRLNEMPRRQHVQTTHRVLHMPSSHIPTDLSPSASATAFEASLMQQGDGREMLPSRPRSTLCR